MDDTRSGPEADGAAGTGEADHDADPVTALEGMDPAEAVAAAERHAAELAARLEGVVGRPGEPESGDAGPDGPAGGDPDTGEAGEGPGR